MPLFLTNRFDLKKRAKTMLIIAYEIDPAKVEKLEVYGHVVILYAVC